MPIFKSTPLFVQYMYRNDAKRILVRVPKELSPTQAAEYETWLRKI
jgi:hypothetical protein